jgi:hypothetical protein
MLAVATDENFSAAADVAVDKPEKVVFDLGTALTVVLSAANVGPDEVNSFLQAVRALESEAVADALFVDGALDMLLLFENDDFNRILEAAGFDEGTMTQITANAASFTLGKGNDSGCYARLPNPISFAVLATLASCTMH